MTAGASVVRVPRALARYACERSLRCCQRPVRVPCEEAEAARVAGALRARGAEALAATVLARREVVDGGLVIAQGDDGVCAHLARDDGGGACAIHLAGGLGALTAGCRNYPRWVARAPDGALEVAFALTCPTAARLVCADARPFAWVEAEEAEAWPFGPTWEAPAEVALDAARGIPVGEALALREAWWARLAAAREAPGALAEAIASLGLDVGHPAAEPSGAAAWLGEGVARAVKHQLVTELARTAERGGRYALLEATALHALLVPVSEEALVDAVSIAPEVVAAVAEQGVAWLALHDRRPLATVARVVARRAALVARTLALLAEHAPYGIDTLARDAVVAASFIGA